MNQPTEQQIAGNESIALSLGAIKKNDQPDLYPNGYYDFGDGKDWASNIQLKYHSDWNWLIGAYKHLGLESVPVDIEPAWLQLVEITKLNK